MDAQQLEQVRALVAAAVGVVPERGDVVVVQSLKAFGPVPESAPLPAPAGEAPGQVRHDPASTVPALAWILALAAAVAVAIGVWLFRRKTVPSVRVLSAADRDVALRQLQTWLHPDGENTAAFSATGAMRPTGERS
jgi:flagellar M-ring protein FliF